MHQQVAVGVGNCVGQLQKQLQTLFHAKPRHSLVEGLAVDQLHHEKRDSIGTQTGVEQGGDVRVIQPCQRLALLRETLEHRRTVHTAFEQFDCRTPLETAISPVRLEHIAHATDTQRAHNSPGPQVHPRAVHHCQQVHRRWLTQKATARAGLIALTQTTAIDLADDRVTANAVAPLADSDANDVVTRVIDLCAPSGSAITGKLLGVRHGKVSAANW